MSFKLVAVIIIISAVNLRLVYRLLQSLSLDLSSLLFFSFPDLFLLLPNHFPCVLIKIYIHVSFLLEGLITVRNKCRLALDFFNLIDKTLELFTRILCS